MAARTKKRELTKRSVATLKRWLQRRRSELAGEIQQRIRENQLNSPSQVLDPVDAADREMNTGFVIMVAEADARELDQVQDALKRIEQGEYGQCQSCDGPIGYQRLKALPFVTLCLPCKRDQERSGEPAVDGRQEAPGPRGRDVVLSDADDEAEADVAKIEADALRGSNALGMTGL